ncbi:MAG: prolyl oligopeptidase family serine peptidase [Acidobacteria bacterium]|nr:prolyl oligopeptidase family serine peptidase [Acidobacteriota bacterium]MBI3426921.1 prolyl oligopeptidase family serine peptidase [Acidobacteriota bacterium]
MRQIKFRIIATLLFVLLLALPGYAPAYAQDASQVLRTSVGFRTVKNTAQMDEATRQAVTNLEKQAQAANAAQKYGEALKHYAHGMVLMRKQEWTPRRAFETALQLKPNKLIFDPGEIAHIKVTQTFALDEPLSGKFTLTLALSQARTQPGVTTSVSAAPPPVLKELKTLKEVAADFSKELLLEAVLPQAGDGNYQLLLTLTPVEGAPIVKPASIRIERELNAKANQLKARIAAVRTDLEQRNQDVNHQELLLALPRADYTALLIDMVNDGSLPLDRVAWASEFANAHAMLDQISKGVNPLKGKRGDIPWAYNSAVDNTVQPYRLFVPAKYDAKQKWPLIVALHGMGGDENSFFNGYAKGAIKEEAEKHGYLIVCPKGRGSASMYLGAAERDVLDVLKEAKRQFNIDENRVYLMGHSMGGYGTWSVAVNNPELFAALAPISGGGIPPVVLGLKKIAHVPWIVTHGDKDPTVSVEESRKMVKAGKDLGIEIKYNEVPGGDHGSVAVPAFPEIFDWFDAHKRQPKAAVKTAGSGQ